MRLAAKLCVAVAGAAAFFVLLTWVTDQWMLGTLGPDYIPMAPSTASAVLLLSMSVFLCLLRARPAPVTAICWVSVASTVVLCLFGLAAPLINADLLFAAWLVPIRTQVAGIPVGIMSPLTAAALLLSAAALALEIPPFDRRRGNRQLASVLALASGLGSSLVVLGYVLDAPILYETKTVPMAMPTGITLALLSVGLIHNASPGTWPMSLLLPDPSVPPVRSAAKGPVAAFLLLFAAILVVGGFYLKVQHENMRRAAQAELVAIADLKARDIARWRRDRLDEAFFFANAAFVSRDVQAFFADPADEKARADILDWLNLLKGDRYTRAVIFDAGGNARISVLPGPVSPKLQALVAETVSKNAVNLTDLHEVDHGGVHLDLLVPVRAPGVDPAEATPIAVIALCIDPRRLLFPLLQSWPTPSPSAEVLMVRRDGEEVLYLNELRHRKGTATRLRLPLNRPQLPAAMAVQGVSGLFEGVDYRSARVVSVLRAVPDSPWHLVVKMDKDEIYAASRRRATQVTAIMALLMLVSGLAVAGLWRRRDLEHFRVILAQEQRQAVLAQRFEHLMRQAHDLILMTGPDGKILEANDRAIQVYSRSLKELREMTLSQLHAPEAREMFRHQLERLEENGSVVFETVHERADGVTFPVEASARLLKIGGEKHRLFIMRDITERRDREREISRINRLYAALSNVNQAIVRSQSRSEMLDRVCQALVEHGGFRTAWIGRHDPDTKSVRLCAGRSPDGAVVSEVTISTEESAQDQSPTIGAAVREDRPVVCHDLAAAPCSAALRREIDAAGILASAAFPVHLGGRVWGVLAVGCEDDRHFGDREVLLLEEAANDVSFALENLEREAERGRAEEALRRSEANLALAESIAHVGYWERDINGDAITWSDEAYRVFGLVPQERAMDLPSFLERVHPEDRAAVSEAIHATRTQGKPYDTEYRIVRPDGAVRYVHSRAELFLDAQGRPDHLFGTMLDITERKRAAARLQEAAQRWRSTFDAISDAIFVLDADGIVMQCNLAAAYLVDRSPHGVLGQDCAALIEGARGFVPGDPMPEALAAGGRTTGEILHNGRWYAATVNPLFSARNGLAGAVHVMKDITERKNAEDALRESERRFRIIAENTGDVIWRLDASTRRFTYISPSVLRLRGYTPEEAMSQDIRHALTPESYERLSRQVLERVAAFKAGDESARIMAQEVEQPHRDGSILTTEVVSTLLADAQGNITEILGVTRDITARKRAEEALRESERRFRIIAENTGDVIWQLDLATLRFTYVSPSVFRLRGYTPEEVMAQPIEAALSPDSFRLVAEGIAAHLAAPESSEELRQQRTSIVEQPRKDGSIVTTEVVTTALTDGRGNVTGVLGVSRDITERMRAEEALRKSEQRFRATFEDALFGMALASPEGRFVEVNPALCHMLGYSEAELRERSFIEITHPDDVAESLEAVQRLLSGAADTFELEKRYLDRQGHAVWGVVKTRLLRNPDGTPRLIVAQVQDVTERKRAEQEILANQDRLKRAQAVGHIGSWEYDPDSRKVWGSEEACRILGFPEAEGELDADRVEARIQDYVRVRQEIVKQLEERGACDVEFVINPLDSSAQRSLRVVAELVRDAEGRPAKVVGVAEDITEQRQTAEVLRETQERLHLALESSGVGTWDWIVREHRHVWDANTRHLFGLNPDHGDDVARRFLSAVHPEDRDRLEAELTHALRGQSEVDAEFRMVWSDGSVHDISARGKVYRDAAGRAIRMTGICWDITARKEAESLLKAYSDNLERVVSERTRQLRDAQDELVRKGKLAVLGQLAGGVGHELRNPLGVISNAVYFLKLTNEGVDETSKEYLNIISSEVYNSQKIISDLLGFARTSQAERSPVALSVLATEVLAQISPGKEVNVVLEIPEDLPLLSVDPGQMKQVLSNLILNACQAMPGGGRLTVSASCAGNRVRVSITDTGCGMSGEELARIFEPLYSTKARGIGLGLSVTRNLVEANEGSIEVISEPGQGSTFTVLLPAQE